MPAARPALSTLVLALGLLAPGAAGQAPMPPVDDWVPSPNITRRTGPRPIRFVVIHTCNAYWRALNWFHTPDSHVSAHFTISETGRLGQSVREEDDAWHSGNGAYNRESIGIEHVGRVDVDGSYTDACLRKSAALTRYLCDRYGIPIDRDHIVGHVEVPGATHTDPGRYFPWDYYLSLVRAAGQTGSMPVDRSVRAVEVTASVLNVRDGVWGTILGQVERGDRFVRTGAQSGWIRIWYGGRQGWFYGGYTRPVSTGRAFVIESPRAPVRSRPGADQRLLGRAHEGEAYVRRGRSGAWRRIQWDDRRGWLHSNRAKSVPIR